MEEAERGGGGQATGGRQRWRSSRRGRREGEREGWRVRCWCWWCRLMTGVCEGKEGGREGGREGGGVFMRVYKVGNE